MSLSKWIAMTMLLNCVTALAQIAPEQPIQLFMADGQLKSHPIRVFINHDISDDMQPKLELARNHAITSSQTDGPYSAPYKKLARQQTSTQQISGQSIAVTGTLMLFDLKNYPVPWYKTVERFTPTVVWNDGGKQHTAISEHEVYIANTLSAFIIPLALLMAILSAILWLAKRSGRPPIDFLCNNGVLSLSRTQVTLWTLMIAWMVLAYGLMRLEVPAIPESLIALMGLSLATGGISYMQDEKTQTSVLPANRASDLKPQLSDLIVDYSVRGQGNLSLTRAQMLVWTLLTLLLFVVKSIFEGDLWNVPWELVVLMGLSQASYLAPKINPPTTNN